MGLYWIIICIFTCLIHWTESVVYAMRLAGIGTRQLAVSMSFVSSSLLVSRLSNMFQAPLLGALVDHAVLAQTPESLAHLIFQMRIIILCGFVGSLLGALMAPTMVHVFERAIRRFSTTGSLPRTILYGLHPRRLIAMGRLMRFPRLSQLKTLRFHVIPKKFFVLNMAVTAIYTIGVMCALLAGAYLPEFRATAIQLSGIVNGLATILFTLILDPLGAKITDDAYQGNRPIQDVQSVVFNLLLGRLVGTAILAQLMMKPFAAYIVLITKFISQAHAG